MKHEFKVGDLVKLTDRVRDRLDLDLFLMTITYVDHSIGVAICSDGDTYWCDSLVKVSKLEHAILNLK